MAYSSAYMARDLTPLLEDQANPTDNEINKMRRRAESIKLDVWLAARYKTPLRPRNYLSGTISGAADTKVITGVGTSFLTDFIKLDVLQIAGTQEAVRISSVDSDTQITTESNIETTFSGSNVWKIPDEIATASEFLTVGLLVSDRYAEQASNQDEVEKYIKRYTSQASAVIALLKAGKYINTDLEEQEEEKGSEGLISYDDTSDLRSGIEDNLELVISPNFIK